MQNLHRLFHCMIHKSANNGSRQNTISIVKKLLVVKPTELDLTPRKGKIFPRARSMPIQYGAHTACYSMKPVNKCSGNETDKKCFFQDKRRVVYTVIPSTFCTERVLHSLIFHKKMAGTVIRGYLKDRNLCVTLDLQMTLHSAASWIYQVLVLFITVINAN
jgi:hypothetical protein